MGFPRPQDLEFCWWPRNLFFLYKTIFSTFSCSLLCTYVTFSEFSVSSWAIKKFVPPLSQHHHLIKLLQRLCYPFRDFFWVAFHTFGIVLSLDFREKSVLEVFWEKKVRWLLMSLSVCVSDCPDVRMSVLPDSLKFFWKKLEISSVPLM